MPVTKFTLTVPSIGYEKTISLNIKEEQKMTIFPRLFIDSSERMNYNFDWNRKGDEKLGIRSAKQIKCTEGLDVFNEYYDVNKKQIDGEDYYPPYLRMFHNNKHITGKNVIISLYVTFEDERLLRSEKISLKYDTSLFDIGFTSDGENINSSEFLFEKKFFLEKDSIYSIEISDIEEKKLVKVHKLLIKCKSPFSEDKELQFIDKSGNIVGYLIIRPHINIHSNRKVTFVKILRKSYKEQDRKAIKENILDNYIVDENNNIVNIETKTKNENEALKIFHKHMLSHHYSRLGVSFPSEIRIDEIEIDDIKSLSVRFHKDVQTKYLELKGIKKENYKDHLIFFISPIHHTDNMASVFYDNVYMFSVMIYGFVDVAILHEVAHKMGLSHTFKDSYLTDTINETQKNINKNKYSEWNDIYQKNKNRKSFTYGEKNISNSEFLEMIKKQQKEKEENEKLLLFLKRVQEYHRIYFVKSSTDNIMDYSSYQYAFFDYQLEIIKKLNNEFNHI